MDTKVTKSESIKDRYGSTILGFIVVLVLGIFLFNVFRGNDADNKKQGDIAETGESSEEALPDGSKRYIVKAGDTLWSIAVDQYDNGYDWTKIMEMNQISNPDEIEEGRELVLPKIAAVAVAGKIAKNVAGAIDEARQQKNTENAQIEQLQEEEQEQITQTSDDAQPEKISEKTAGDLPTDVTVQPGDTLWSIAVIVYGDGYQWSNIAQANKLANPDIIHAGNVLQIPPAR